MPTSERPYVVARHRHPERISLPTRPGDLGLGEEFAMPFQTIEGVLPLGGEQVLIIDDSNYPFSAGRSRGARTTRR